MNGIPPAQNTDVEDVVWALQTADALWKRSERGDALVWLRRAAQAAGAAEDDDRALALARAAAELTDWMGRPSAVPRPVTSSVSAPALEPLLAARPSSARSSRTWESAPDLFDAGLPTPLSTPIAPMPPSNRAFRPQVSLPAPPHPPSSQRVPTAAESHAGMLDPWSESDSQKPPPRQPSREKIVVKQRDDNEIVTSAKPLPTHRLKPALVPRLDLSKVEAFGDLPDDARDTLARGANLQTLAKGQEVSDFALALVLEGSVHVVLRDAHVVASTLEKGGVLRAKGSFEQALSLRLVCASESAKVATWSDEHVHAALGTCPWVEEELRSAGDRFQALAGMTLGPLGGPSYEGVRLLLALRLQVRALGPHEIWVKEADPLSGLAIVGAGEIEWTKGDSVEGRAPRGGFVFPSQVLSAACAPATARAGAEGALVLHVDRATTQELMVTEPLLLELLAS